MQKSSISISATATERGRSSSVTICVVEIDGTVVFSRVRILRILSHRLVEPASSNVGQLTTQIHRLSAGNKMVWLSVGSRVLLVVWQDKR